MISNKKKSSIKSLNEKSMPLFDNIEDKNREKQVDSKTKKYNSNNKSQNSSSTPKQTTFNSKAASTPKTLTSLNSTPDNKEKTQNKQRNNFGQRQPLTSNQNIPAQPPVSPNKQTHTFNSNSLSGNISLGMYLQEARVKAGYSLNQVAMITKLNIHYIEAIERDDFKNTPPLIYIKAYIKKLAALYKIDVEKALELLKPPDNHDKQIPSKLIQELQETKQVNQKDEAKIKLMLQFSIVGLLVIILICLIIGLIYWFSSGSNTDSSMPRTSSISQDTSLKPLTVENKTEISKEMEKLIVPQSIKLTELPIPQK